MIPATSSEVEIVDGHARAAGVPTKCPKCGGEKLTQDKAVLDTWFSSALWPFSTLGWPDDTEDLRTFYPNSLLISGYDILFFWDARMIMMGLHLAPGASEKDRIPFRRLYLHSLVRTAEGAKMSKTKGTGVNPLELTQQYGTDALRYMLASMAAPGTDIALTEDRILGARAFANKIWNAARFLFMNLEKAEANGIKLEEVAAPEIRAGAPYSVAADGAADHLWIFSRLNTAIREMNSAMQEFRFHEASQTVYRFFWDDFCDWYIEWIKPQLASPDRTLAVVAWKNIFSIFDTALRLLHPVMPFLTEELWHKLPQSKNARSIAFARFPEPRESLRDLGAEAEMALLQEVILAARQIRAELKIEQKRKVPAELSSEASLIRSLIESNREPLMRLALLSDLQVSSGTLNSEGAAVRSRAQFDLRIAYGDAVDKPAEIAKLRKEIERLAKDIETKKARLADETFTSKAPAKVVDDFKATLAARETEYQKLVERLKKLQ
jgi:valyl-tRNA synthetase